MNVQTLIFPQIGFVRMAIAAPRRTYVTGEWSWEASEVLEVRKLASAEKSRYREADQHVNDSLVRRQ